MELPGTYPCGAQPWDMSGAAVLPEIRFIPHSDNYKGGLQPVPVPGNPPSVMPLVPHFGPSREPPSSPASEPGAGQRLGRSRRRRPEGKGNTRELRTYCAAAPGRRGWTRASGTVTVTGTVTGSVPRAGAARL